MKVEKIIVLVKLEDGSIKQVQLNKDQIDQIAKVAITSTVVLSKVDLRGVVG